MFELIILAVLKFWSFNYFEEYICYTLSTCIMLSIFDVFIENQKVYGILCIELDRNIMFAVRKGT